MSHYGFKIQDENWSFRRSLPVEKFSNLFFLKSDAFVHLKSSLLREAVPSEWLPPAGDDTRKNGASVHKDPGQSGWRGTGYGGPWVVPGGLSRDLRPGSSECTHMRRFLCLSSEAGPQNLRLILVYRQLTSCFSCANVTFSINANFFFLLFMWRINIEEIWLQKPLWKGAQES